MSSLVIAGDTSGSVTLQAPAVAGTTILTLPATSGTLITTASGTASSATTATNLAGGSAGVLPYQTGSGATSFTAAGTAGQVLQSNGASAPTWVAPSTGAMSLVSTLTASSSASLSWTGLTGNRYRLYLENILNSGVDLYLQLGYGATPTWITSGYTWLGPSNSDASGTTSKISSNGATGNGFYPKYYMSSVGRGMSVTDLTGFTNGVAQLYTNIEHSNNTANYYYTSSSGSLVNTNNITAVRLISASGTIASGSASLYLISQ
jgi:hypothetical protein